MINQKMKLKNDIILIAATLLIAAIALTAYVLSKEIGNKVVVTVDGEFYGEYPLSENAVIEIYQDDKGQKNVLVIENGKAYISEANCPDLICVNHTPVSNIDESIICLPNKTIVSIE